MADCFDSLRPPADTPERRVTQRLSDFVFGPKQPMDAVSPKRPGRRAAQGFGAFLCRRDFDPLRLPEWISPMNKFYGFLLRFIMSAVLAVVLARTFYPDFRLPFTIGLGLFFLGMAYFLDYLRSRPPKI
jgi:hypothetical protein